MGPKSARLVRRAGQSPRISLHVEALGGMDMNHRAARCLSRARLHRKDRFPRILVLVARSLVVNPCRQRLGDELRPKGVALPGKPKLPLLALCVRTVVKVS